jgi:hypothetical protein
LVIFPVMDPSAFCFQLLKTGMLSLGVILAAFTGVPTFFREMVPLGRGDVFFTAVLAAGVFFAPPPKIANVLDAGAAGVGVGAGTGVFATAPPKKFFLGAGAGVFFG